MAPLRNRQDEEEKLLAIVRGLVLELHPRRRDSARVALDSRFDRDLGIDSLARAELMLRVEGAFRVRLPESLLGEMESPADFLTAIDSAALVPETGARPAEVPVIPELPVVTETPEAARTLIDVLQWHVARHPDRPHVTILQDDRKQIGSLSYRDLEAGAKEFASGLTRAGVEVGERVALMLPTSADFFIAFLGTIYAGAVPVPIYPPFRPTQLEEHLRRQAGILSNAGASLLITAAEAQPVAALLKLQVETLRGVESVESLRVGETGALPSIGDGAAVALIQYTSGSTGDPKGVVLSHANLLANIRAMGQAMEASSTDVFVSWLPLYHDMGLIGAWLGSLYYAARLYVMSPLTFIVRPEAWLWAIHRYRATLSAAPNFAFELCLNKVDDELLEGLDLSSLRMVANGAEPVSPNTVRRFTERFGRYGFRPEALAPAYGLAENAVGLAFPPLERLPRIDRLRRDALTHRGVVEPAAEDDPTALEFTSCGLPLPNHEIRIVGETGHEIGERQQGRLEFRGPSTTSGYFRNEEKTRGLFDGDWLDSGDLGYIAEGEVFVTGRIKDVIIRAGRNIYPQEVEEAVGDVPGILKNCVAVFGCADPTSGSERLIVLAETQETGQARLDEIRARIGEMVVDLLGIPADEVVFAPPGSVPKTSSGKIRRAAARKLYETKRIGRPQRRLWLQVLFLKLRGILTLARGRLRSASSYLYAGYWWLVIGTALGLIWLLMLAIPRLSWRWRVLRGGARAALRLAGVPVSVSGLNHLPDTGGILVCNHASYLDPLVLAAVLPGEPVFAAKQELAPQIFAGRFLRRLGAFFVERWEPEGGVAATQAALELARRCRLLVFFPEGTFRREPGLLPFQLGAFAVAADARLPVVPAAIQGTRSILRGGQWFPLRGSVHLDFGSPIEPGEPGFSGALKLREAARSAILEHSGEPDLGQVPS